MAGDIENRAQFKFNVNRFLIAAQCVGGTAEDRRKSELGIRRILKIPVPYGVLRLIIIYDDDLMARVLSDGNGLVANKV